MNLLKPIICSIKTMDFCFLCFRKDKNSFDIHTMFEIRNNYDVICLSLNDMIKDLFPHTDFVFTHACNDCSDLISELYILIRNRKSKILLLDSLVEQLLVNTSTVCGIPVTNDRVVLNVQLPTFEESSNTDRIPGKNNQNNKNSLLNCLSNKDTYENNNDTGVEELKVCRYCSKTFLHTNEYRGHLQIHRKKRKRKHRYHYCLDCDYKTLSKTTLQAHVNKAHLNTRPHICGICFKGFYNKSNLNEHIKTHNNERHHICEQCGCSFLHKKSLVEHLRLHSDTRPYKCDICNKCFITSGRRSDHIKRSHMEKTECCVICNKKYSLKKELTRHLNNVHLRGT